MHKYRQYVLPAALVLGLLLHNVCASLSFLVPFLIFTILFLTFTAVDIKKLRIEKIHVWLMVYQLVASALLFMAVTWGGGHKIVAEGLMMASLTPVAASSTVVACMLGANRQTMTGYSIIGNLFIALVAPLFFTLIGDHPEHSLGMSYLLMMSKIGSTLALPFFLALAMQRVWPKANATVARYSGMSYYVWALALLLTIGQTIHYIFNHGAGHWHIIAWLGALSLASCALQFWLGRKLGHRYGDPISGAQLMGQKNSAMGIWMCSTFLSPLSSVFMAFYSVYQNLFNAWQIAKHK